MEVGGWVRDSLPEKGCWSSESAGGWAGAWSVGGSATSEGPGKSVTFILSMGLTESNPHFKFIAFPVLWRES